MTTEPTSRQRLSFLQRIAEAARKAKGADGCWHWRGGRNHNSGYPRIRFMCPFRGRIVSMSVHRAIMERERGRQLATGEYVLHRPHCSKDCVRPDHLRVGSARENTADAREAGRLHNYFLKAWQVRRIVRLSQEGVRPGKIAERFGVQGQTVWAIVTGRAHRKVTGIGLDAIHEKAHATKAWAPQRSAGRVSAARVAAAGCASPRACSESRHSFQGPA